LKINKSIILYFLIIVIYIIGGFHFIRKNKIKEIDKQLFVAASSIDSYLGNNFHSKNLDKDSITHETIFKNTLFLTEKANIHNVEYLYTIFEKDGKLFYTSTSEELEEGFVEKYGNYTEEEQELYNELFWFSLDDAEDSSINEIISTLYSTKTIYITSTDIWGKFRSVYIPKISDDGTKYLMGADVLINTLNMSILKDLINVYLYGALILGTIFGVKKIDQFRFNKLIRENKLQDIETGLYHRKTGLRLLGQLIKELNHTDKNLFLICITFDDKHLDRLPLKKKLLTGIINKTIPESNFSFQARSYEIITVIKDPRKNPKDFKTSLISSIEAFNALNKKEIVLSPEIAILNYDSIDKSEKNLFALLNKMALNKDGVKDFKLETEILEGLKKDEFVIYYQPKIDMKSKKVNLEALMRWNHPTYGLIYPDKFIPVAEKSFLIFKLTRYLIEKVVEDSKTLNTKISLNISGMEFKNREFLESLKSYPENLDHLTFEITETAFMENFENSLNSIYKLRELGVDLSLDDFGTGYSSLGYLAKIPVSELKIDKSFVQDLNSNKVNEIIIKSILSLASSLNIKVVAEGCEDAETIKNLHNMGCYYFQGYFFDRALPFKEIDEKLNNDFYLEKIKEIDI